MIPGMLLNQTVAICENMGSGAWGQTYGEPKNIKCRWEPINKRSKGEKADTITSHIQLFCNPIPEMVVGARVIIEGESYVVDTAEPVPGLFGNINHLEVVLNASEC